MLKMSRKRQVNSSLNINMPKLVVQALIEPTEPGKKKAVQEKANTKRDLRSTKKMALIVDLDRIDIDTTVKKTNKSITDGKEATISKRMLLSKPSAIHKKKTDSTRYEDFKSVETSSKVFEEAISHNPVVTKSSVKRKSLKPAKKANRSKEKLANKIRVSTSKKYRRFSKSKALPVISPKEIKLKHVSSQRIFSSSSSTLPDLYVEKESKMKSGLDITLSDSDESVASSIKWVNSPNVIIKSDIMVCPPSNQNPQVQEAENIIVNESPGTQSNRLELLKCCIENSSKLTTDLLKAYTEIKEQEASDDTNLRNLCEESNLLMQHIKENFLKK